MLDRIGPGPMKMTSRSCRWGACPRAGGTGCASSGTVGAGPVPEAVPDAGLDADAWPARRRRPTADPARPCRATVRPEAVGRLCARRHGARLARRPVSRMEGPIRAASTAAASPSTCSRSTASRSRAAHAISSSRDQSSDADDLEPGDLLFFTTTGPARHTWRLRSAPISSSTRRARPAWSAWSDSARAIGRSGSSARAAWRCTRTPSREDVRRL